jgi:hypothetical protein
LTAVVDAFFAPAPDELVDFSQAIKIEQKIILGRLAHSLR